MAPYIKGVIHGRHVFDLTLTISHLRRMIRLLQSLILDECNILFVCNGNNEDLKTLAQVMCARVNIPLLDSKWQPGSLTNWDWMAFNYRGTGKLIQYNNESEKAKKINQKKWEKTKLHRMCQSPPDFIFLMNRKFNDILVYEANRMNIPVASLCDSDDSTRDLQYVIPCNHSSIPSLYFILDFITRGILEAQSKMDACQWWAKKRDIIDHNAALKEAELELQQNYDAYEQTRMAKMMVGGGGKTNPLQRTPNRGQRQTPLQGELQQLFEKSISFIPINFGAQSEKSDLVSSRRLDGYGQISTRASTPNEGNARDEGSIGRGTQQMQMEKSLERGATSFEIQAEQKRVSQLSNVRNLKVRETRQANKEFKVQNALNDYNLPHYSDQDFAMRMLARYARNRMQK